MSRLIRVLATRAGFASTALVLVLLLVLTVASFSYLWASASSESPLDQEAYAELTGSRLTHIDDLLGWFFDQQELFGPIVPPGLEYLIQPGHPDILAIDLDSQELPTDFTQALEKVIPVWRNSVPCYEVLISGNWTGKIEIRDMEGNLLHQEPAPKGYLPAYKYLAQLDPWDPAQNRYRLQAKLTLLPMDYAEFYLYAQQQIAEAAEEEPDSGGMLLMMGGGSCEELRIAEMYTVSNGLLLNLCYPPNLSGTVWSVYGYDAPVCPETDCPTAATQTFLGLDRVWSIIYSNLLLTGETATAWIDEQPLAVDTNGNPVNRYHVFGATTDTDADGLNDSFESLVSKTQITLADTDGDGARDGAEYEHGTDPLVHPGDSDEDGLSDHLEIVLDLNPNAADSDLDWAGDGYELETGFDPLVATSTPPLSIRINNGALYTANTNLSLAFSGLVADTVVVSENEAFNPAVTNNSASNRVYTLQDTGNGWRTMYGQPRRNGTEIGPLLGGMIVVDTVPPELSVTAPIFGSTTARRWIRVEGHVSDSTTTARAYINGEWADGIVTGSFWQARFPLVSGTNPLVVVAADDAGNAVTQTLAVVQDTNGDSTPPRIALDLTEDYVVAGGVTNWLGTTTLGREELLSVRGWTDDETAEVLCWTVAFERTNGPFAGVVVGTQIWADVRLQPGTNRLTVLATDAAGNTFATNRTVIRDTNVVFAITYPASYTVLNSASTLVYGVASIGFSNAVITVNGVATVLTVTNGEVAFSTVQPIPLQVDRTKIEAVAEIHGRSYLSDPVAVGYEFLEYNYSDVLRYLDMQSGRDCAYMATGTWTWTSNWTASNRVLHASWNIFDKSCTDCDGGPYGCDEDLWTWSTNEFADALSYPILFRAADRVRYIMTAWPDGSYYQGAADFRVSSQLRFIKRWPTQETQTVILQFTNVEWQIPWYPTVRPPVDASQIVLRGQTGFWYRGQVAFVMPIKTETEYVFSDADLDGHAAYDFPCTLPDYRLYHVQGNAVSLLFRTNDILKVGMTAYRPTTEGPAYNNPFQRREIPEDQEETPGAGIRVNGDDDNNNSTADENDTTVNNENDLIEVVLDAAPPAPSSGFKYVLKRSSSNIKVWTAQNKTTALLDANDETNLTFSTTPMTVWVENPGGGTADLELQAKTDSGTVVCSDKVHFYPFTSIVIALGGEDQGPTDPANANHGIFRLAIDLYEQGYDVHMYDEDNVDDEGAGAVFNEVVRAIQGRNVTQVAIYGYSHGGGSTHDLAERLDNNRGTIGTFTIPFTAYIDAVTQGAITQENRRPPGSGFHVNFYQEGSLADGGLDGGPIDNPPGADFEDDVDDPTVTHTHFTVDDDANVLNGIETRLTPRVNR